MTTGSDIAGPPTSGSVWKPQRQRLTTYRDSCHGRAVCQPSFIDSAVESRVSKLTETERREGRYDEEYEREKDANRKKRVIRSPTAVSPLNPYHVAHGRVLTALFVSNPSRACLTLTRKLH
ncbi:hypothetical protein ALC60_01805 [Trachymyrmex zeteki]|uniref:Uncharacterized protein n=1 Tax=Mycetomoellerius zeteki TaxID=64791 RepID=A0A151XFR5_9HYME|nr:hypothetical protein ALC60_01805 [Trachymyrmex zeteki]